MGVWRLNLKRADCVRYMDTDLSITPYWISRLGFLPVACLPTDIGLRPHNRSPTRIGRCSSLAEAPCQGAALLTVIICMYSRCLSDWCPYTWHLHCIDSLPQYVRLPPQGWIRRSFLFVRDSLVWRKGVRAHGAACWFIGKRLKTEGVV